MKRILSLLSVFALLLSTVPFIPSLSFTASAETEGDYTYTVENGTLRGDINGDNLLNMLNAFLLYKTVAGQ